MKFLRINEVLEMTGLSRSALYRLLDTGSFPQQIELGSRSVAWAKHEVEEWMESRIDENRSVAWKPEQVKRNTDKGKCFKYIGAICFRLIPHVDEVNALLNDISANTELTFPLDRTAVDARFYKRLDGIKEIRISFRDYDIVDELRLVEKLAIDLDSLPDYIATEENASHLANTLKKLKLLDELIVYCSNASSELVAKLKTMLSNMRCEPVFIAA